MMRCLLRSQPFRPHSLYAFSQSVTADTTTSSDHRPRRRRSQNSEDEQAPFYNFKRDELVDFERRQLKQFEKQYKQDNIDFKFRDKWQVAVFFLIQEQYQLMRNTKGQSAAQEKLKQHAQALGLSHEHLSAKIFSQDKYYSDLAKYRISQLDPLIDSFLRQNYNFVNKRVLLYLIEHNKVKMLKKIISHNILQDNYFIDDDITGIVLGQYQKDKRNAYLLNLLGYATAIQFSNTEKDIEEETFLQMQAPIFNQILYDMQQNKQINKLRLLWAYQKYYLEHNNLYEFVKPQLKNINVFATGKPKDETRQRQVRKEVAYLLDEAFEEQVWQQFYQKVLQHTQTYPQFISIYSLTFLLLSKLTQIPFLLPQSLSTELHPIFQLVQFNLPKELVPLVLEHLIFGILRHESNSGTQLWAQNYRRCLQYWRKDYTQPQKTKYNNNITSIIEKEENIQIVYGWQEGIVDEEEVELGVLCARSVITLNRTKHIKQRQQENIQGKSQTDMINDLLKGDYNNVLDHFLMRYPLASDFDLSAKYLSRISKNNNKFAFASPQTRSLYHLKESLDHFWHESMTRPIILEDFNALKENISVAAIKDKGLFEGEQLQTPKQMQNTRKQLERIQEELYNRLEAGILDDDRRNNKSLENQNQKEEEENQDEEQEEYDSEDDEKMIAHSKRQRQQPQEEAEQRQSQDPQVQQVIASIIAQMQGRHSLTEKSKEKFKKRLQLFVDNHAKILEEEQIERLIQQEQEQGQEDLMPQQDHSGQSLAKPIFGRAQPQPRQKQQEQQNQVQQEPISLAQLQKDARYEQQSTIVRLPTFDDLAQQQMLEEDLEQSQSQSVQLDGGRDDRAIIHAIGILAIQSGRSKTANRQAEEEATPVEQEEEPVEENYEEEEVREEDEEIITQQPQEEAQQQIEQEVQQAQQTHLSVEQVNRNQREQQLRSQIDHAIKVIQRTSTRKPGSQEIYEFLREELPKLHLFKRKTKAEIQEIHQIRQMRIDIEREEQRDQKQAYRQQMGQKQQIEDNVYEAKQKKTNTNKNKKEFSGGLFKKNKHSFCTVSAQQSNPKEHEKIEQTQIQSQFDFDKIERYRRSEVSPSLLSTLQEQTSISKVGSGQQIAKYLFLYGKNTSKETSFTPSPSRKLSIQFSSIIGTRAKSYLPFLSKTVYPYTLETSFYESLLEDQLNQKYSRYHFKAIVAHMIHYLDQWSDKIIEDICRVCLKQQMGYTFVEIMQFVKVNHINISQNAMEQVTTTWGKFRLINEDMLTFVRQYTRQQEMAFKTVYYNQLAKNLIKTEQFEKLQALISAVLVQIKPRPFKIEAHMKPNEVPELTKQWKIQQQQKYIVNYLELIEVVVSNLQTKIPTYMLQLFDEYTKLTPGKEYNQKQLGYGFVCTAMTKPKFLQLLAYLQRHKQYGTEFMYDCCLQALQSNFNELQEYSEKIFQACVINNRVILSNDRILRAVNIFKRTSTSNAFSKFLEHCIRFQEGISTSFDIKKEMFYVLNNNVDDLSVGGVFNLLDFIFSTKREEERVEYRKIKLSEEQKQRKLAQVQQTTAKAGPHQYQLSSNQKNKDNSNDLQPIEESPEAKDINTGTPKSQKQKVSKQEIKREKAVKTLSRKKANSLADQLVAQVGSNSVTDAKQIQVGSGDTQIVNMVKNQSKRHESIRRKGARAFGQLYQGAIEIIKAEEEASKQKVQKKGGKANKK